MSGADNQQERLGSTESANWFLAGFIEGEGALCVSIKKHPTCRSSFYVDPGFFLYQHESGRRLLELAQSTFENGRIYPKSGNPKVLVYEISSTRALRDKVVPFFERYVLPFSCKREPSSGSARSSRRWSEANTLCLRAWPTSCGRSTR